MAQLNQGELSMPREQSNEINTNTELAEVLLRQTYSERYTLASFLALCIEGAEDAPTSEDVAAWIEEWAGTQLRNAGLQ